MNYYKMLRQEHAVLYTILYFYNASFFSKLYSNIDILPIFDSVVKQKKNAGNFSLRVSVRQSWNKLKSYSLWTIQRSEFAKSIRKERLIPFVKFIRITFKEMIIGCSIERALFWKCKQY